jgi:hypothetical protein
MATATVSRGTPPTEAEIRQALAEFVAEPMKHGDDSPRAKLDEAIDKAMDVVGYVHIDPVDEIAVTTCSDLWSDLRPSEARRLAEIVAEAKDRALEAAWVVIVKEVTRAGLTFAAEYPDAPRARVEVTAG